MDVVFVKKNLLFLGVVAEEAIAVHTHNAAERHGKGDALSVFHTGKLFLQHTECGTSILLEATASLILWRAASNLALCGFSKSSSAPLAARPHNNKMAAISCFIVSNLSMNIFKNRIAIWEPDRECQLNCVKAVR